MPCRFNNDGVSYSQFGKDAIFTVPFGGTSPLVAVNHAVGIGQKQAFTAECVYIDTLNRIGAKVAAYCVSGTSVTTTGNLTSSTLGSISPAGLYAHYKHMSNTSDVALASSILAYVEGNSLNSMGEGVIFHSRGVNMPGTMTGSPYTLYAKAHSIASDVNNYHLFLEALSGTAGKNFEIWMAEASGIYFRQATEYIRSNNAGIIAFAAATKLKIETDMEFDDAKNIIINTTTGTKIGTGTTQKLGFWNATPIVQPSNIVSLTDNSGGSANDIIAAITEVANAGSADIGPIKDAIADIAAKVNAILSLINSTGMMS